MPGIVACLCVAARRQADATGQPSQGGGHAPAPAGKFPPHTEAFVPPAMNVNAISDHLIRLNALAAIIGYL